MTGAPTIPVDIVGGFLGSGKTTLLRRLLEQGTGERVAVVVNEFGEIGIDGLVVGGLGYGERMVELSSGCICCQLDTLHFEIALEELCDDVKPDRIVIETSGVADPGALARRLADLGRPLGSLITVVDTVNLDRVLAEPIGRDQIAAADFLVLSKLDLPETRGLPAAEGRLRVVNARAPVIPAPVGNDGLQLLFGSGLPPAVDDRAARRAEAPTSSRRQRSGRPVPRTKQTASPKLCIPVRFERVKTRPAPTIPLGSNPGPGSTVMSGPSERAGPENTLGPERIGPRAGSPRSGSRSASSRAARSARIPGSSLGLTSPSG